MCLFYKELLMEFFRKKPVSPGNQNCRKVQTRNASKHVTNKSRYDVRVKKMARRPCYYEEFYESVETHFPPRQHGRRALVSVKVRYGFLLGVWWPGLYDCLCAWTLLILSQRLIPTISYRILHFVSFSTLFF